MKSKFISFLFILLFCTSSNLLFAQKQKYFSQHITQSEGLPQNSINKLAFTRHGFLWMATEDGLVRFDGVNFRIFSMFNQPAIKNDRFKSIIKDKNDVLHVYNADGVRYRINENSLEYSESQPLLSNLTGLHPANNNFDQILHRSNPFNIAPIPSHLLSVNDNLLLTSRYKSIVLFRGNKIADTLGFRFNQIASFFKWGSDNFIFTNDGIIYKIEISNTYKLSLRKITIFKKQGRALYKVFFKHSGQVFVTYNNTIHRLRLNDGLFILEPIYSLLSKDEIITDIDVESERDIIAVGTLTNGIYLLRPNYFSYMRDPDPAAYHHQPDPFFAFTLYNDSMIVTAKKQFFKGEKYQSSINYSKPLSQEVLDAHKGYIYFAKQNEIISYHPSTNSFDNVFKTISGDVSVIQHWGDTMFCADKQFFYIIYQDKLITKIEHSNTQNRVRINDVLKIHDKIYLASSSGLLLYHQNHKKLKKYRADLNIRSINTYDDRLFICTFGNGVVVVDKEKFYQLNYDALGLISKSHVTLCDSLGRFWVGTNNGLYVIQYRDVLRRIKDSTYTINYIKYDKQNGLLSAEFNGGRRPSAVEDNNGQFYFSTMSGIVYFNPYVLSKVYKNVPIFADEFRINDKLILYDGKEINIARDGSKSLLKIQIATPYWKNKENEVLFYKVIGPLTYSGRISLSRPIINISYLPSGRYRILVIKTNSFDNQIQQIKFDVNIQKEFYESWWFWVLIVTLVALLLILSVYIYNLSLLKQKRMLASIVKRRTQDLEISNQMLLASERELRQTVTVKSKLVSIISHDIVTPLKFMSMVTQANLDKETDVKGLLTDVQITTGRLYQNAQNILNWIKYQDKRITPIYEAVSLYVLVQDIGDLLEQAIQTNNNTFYNKVDPDVIVKTDRTVISIILQNLIANSAKYVKNSSISVSYDFIDFKHHLTIEDNGCGINQSTLNRLNKIIQGEKITAEQAKNIDSSGTGLGYYIISDLSDLIGLTVAINSTEAVGTRVTIQWLDGK